MSDERERESAVDKLARLARCMNGGATGLAFIIGSPAWFRCVRERDHKGECVMGLSAYELAVVEGRQPVSGWIQEDPDVYRARLRAKHRKAKAAEAAAWGA